MKDKIINIIKENKRLIICFICILIFVSLIEDVLEYEIIDFDTTVFTMISSIRTDFVTKIFKIITTLGGAIWLACLSILSLIILKNKKIGTMICLNLVTIGGLNKILKHIVQRPRPIENRLIEESGYSFPSGHSMASMAFYGLIIYFIFKYIKNKKARNTLCILLSILIILIGISRIYLGVHYASDVLAGFVLSIAYLAVFTAIIPKIMNIE